MKPDSIVPPPHSRGTFDETVFCAAGAITFTVNGKPVPLTAGDARFIQRGAIHGFRPGPERGATSCASPREVAA